MSKNPYSNFPSSSYWKPSISEKSCFDIDSIWKPKYEINERDKYATYGSCFAQHFSNALRQKGIKWIDAEQCPKWISNAVSYFNKILIKKNIKYFIQPYKTFHPSRYQTFLEFSVDSQRLGIEDGFDAEKHADNDLTHMNNKFGTVFLESFINKIS